MSKTILYLFCVFPDDFSQPSAKSFSRLIRQEIYGLIKPCTFSFIDQEWYIAIALVCFRAKTTRIMKNNL